MLVLSGDVGGTNTRLQLTEFAGFSEFQILAEARFHNVNYGSFSEIVDLFLQAQAVAIPTIAAACFAAAGPIIDGVVKVTNLPWVLSEVELQERFAFAKVALMNDFEAAGYALDNIAEKDLFVLQQGIFQSESPRAMIGAGTGLGVAIGVQKDVYYKVIPTEGGHVDFAPTDEVQMELLKYLHKKLHRVSVERVASGYGIVNIYNVIRENPLFNETENQNLKRILFQAEDPAANISEYAIMHHDPMAMRTLDLFIRIYGAAAGNLALSTLPFGGLYIMGGIAPKLLPQLTDGRFLNALTDKGRMSSLIKNVPIYVVLNTHIGLQGAANFGYLSCL